VKTTRISINFKDIYQSKSNYRNTQATYSATDNFKMGPKKKCVYLHMCKKNSRVG